MMRSWVRSPPTAPMSDKIDKALADAKALLPFVPDGEIKDKLIELINQSEINKFALPNINNLTPEVEDAANVIANLLSKMLPN
jgi:hypothetical protein